MRFGYGGLHLTTIARRLPGATTFKAAYKWLSRFLKNRYFDPAGLAPAMIRLLVGRKPPDWLLVLIDQTHVGGVEVVSAAIPFEGRAVPVAWPDFEYPWSQVRIPSPNAIEQIWLVWVREALPPGVRALPVLDRGYARADLIGQLNRARQPFLLRGLKKVLVKAWVRGREQRFFLGRLPHRLGVPTRFSNVLYHQVKQERVDVIVYREREFQDAWFLIVPPQSEAWLPTETVVELYRRRMQIEHRFRDWKNHLGLRGLELQVNKSERLLRLLMAFTLADLLTLLPGQDELARPARGFFEYCRRRPRHGTRRVLSVLSLALLLLDHPRFQVEARRRLDSLIRRPARGCGCALTTPLPP